MAGFVHLRVTSCYSFLRAAGHPEAYLERAAELGQEALALTEEDYLCALPRFEAAAKAAGILPLLGGTVTSLDGPLTFLCRNRTGYRHLCRLISSTHLKETGDATAQALATAVAELSPPCKEGIKGWSYPGASHRSDLTWPRSRDALDEPTTPNPSFQGCASEAGAWESRSSTEFAIPEQLPSVPGFSAENRSSVPGFSRGGGPAEWGEIEAAGGEDLFVLTGGRRGALAEWLRRGAEDRAEAWLRRLMACFGRRQVVVELHRVGCPGDRELTLRQVGLARRLGLRYAATGDVRYVRREQFPLYDVLCCTRCLETVDTPFPGRPVNDLQYLAGESAVRRRWADLPEAVDETVAIAGECTPLNLTADRFVPGFNGIPPAEQAVYLSRLVVDGVMERYPRHLWRPVFERVKEELRIIRALRLEGYFLLVWDVCRWARAQGIRCAGRGSAAGSVVCYVLRITNVDAYQRDITLARFLNEERTESLPDIDVDFDREGRDKVIDYVVARYGVEHVAMTGTYMRYHARSAIRDVGRALALPPEDVDRLAKSLPRLGCDQIDGAELKYPDVRQSPWAEERYARLRDIVPQMAGIPRHLGTHLGGVIISPEPLRDLVGVQMAAKPFRVIQGDKEDVEDRLCKFDCLCLPMFSVIEDANRFVKRHRPEFEIFAVPLDDEATYARLRRSETIGAFEVGSPAQRTLHARLHCDSFEPLVAALALIRPGPIKGNMVEHYLKRRHGQEPIEYWLPELEPVLAKTYGVMVYQEQVIEVARVAAGLSPAEADLLRRSISHYRSEEAMAKLGESFCVKAVAHGLDAATAASIFEAVRGFAGYGFCESHAAAFADTAYRSVYLIEHHPAEYFAALLRHQPMGFYPPHTLVALAQRRGVAIVGPCVNHGPARTEAIDGRIHIGLAQIKRIQPETAEAIVAARPHPTLGALLRHSQLPKDRLAALIRAGACDSLSPHRRMLLWQLQELEKTGDARPISGRKTGDARPISGGGGDRYADGTDRSHTTHASRTDLPEQARNRSSVPSFSQARNRSSVPSFLEVPDAPPDPRLPEFSVWDRLAGEWEMMGFAVGEHPVGMIREELNRRGVRPVAEFAGAEPDTRFRLAGLVLRPHRPPTRTGRNTLFFDLEDETGVVSVTCFKDVYQRDGHIALHNPVVVVDGKVDRRTGLSLIADRLRPMPTADRMASPHARTLY